MNDDTTRTDGWEAAEASGATPAESASSGPAATEPAWENTPPPVAFCQDCGRPLTPQTLRAVAKSIFCEPCLEQRLHQTPAGGYTAYGNQPAGAAAGSSRAQTSSGGFHSGSSASQPGYAAVPPPTTPVQGEPSPALAALLGLIPGVGAMYNGQFAKGVAHLIIFVALDVLAENVSGVFWIFVWGWIFYQCFEAYHTARARLEGMPLPDPFGFNDIGDRMGFGRSWGPPPATPTAPPPGASSSSSAWTTGPGPASGSPVSGSAVSGSAVSGSAAPTPPPPAPAGYWSAPPPPTAAPAWVGYVPPTAFAQTGAGQPPAGPFRPASAVPSTEAATRGPVPQEATSYTTSQTTRQATQQTSQSTGYVPPPPYQETFSGATPPPGCPPNFYATPERRFPTGALWLIGLGALILLANVVPDWRIGDRWWPSVLLAGLALWLFTRRLQADRGLSGIRWPVILLVLAVLSALHAAFIAITFGMTCAVLLIAFGALLIVERTAGTAPLDDASSAYNAPPTYGYGATPYGSGAEPAASSDPARATFAAAPAPPNAAPPDPAASAADLKPKDGE